MIYGIYGTSNIWNPAWNDDFAKPLKYLRTSCYSFLLDSVTYVNKNNLFIEDGVIFDENFLFLSF